MTSKKIRLIGAASGWGAQNKGCEDGPLAISKKLSLLEFKNSKLDIEWEEIIYPKIQAKVNPYLPSKETLCLIHKHNKELANATTKIILNGDFPIIFGGDHAIAVGTWNGIYRALSIQSQLPLGLIWIDAHMDSHTDITSESGAWHGMPLAGLLGHGVKELSKLLHDIPILDPRNVCLIGIRSFENGEKNLLKNLNVKVFSSLDIKKIGIKNVLNKAIDHVTKNTLSFGVSLDLDVFDPSIAPGVGSPELEGVSHTGLIKHLQLFNNHPALKAIEIVEYNPHLDKNDMTLQILKNCLRSFLIKV